MKRAQEQRYQAYLGLLLGFLLFFTMLAIGGCAYRSITLTKDDNTVIKLTSLTPPGQKWLQPVFEYNRDGEVIDIKLKAEGASQPGVGDYSRGAADILSLIYGRPPPAPITPERE